MRSMRNEKIARLLIFVCFLTGGAFSTAHGQKSKHEGTNKTPRYVDEPDLKSLLARVLTPQGFLDPAFSAAVAKPSRYYSDFFGVQALADTTKEMLKRDFVPKPAEVVGEDQHKLTLKFKSGWTGTFYPHSTIKVMGIEVPFDHVSVSGNTWQEMIKNLEEFRRILKSRGLERRYLIPNPHYQEEMAVAKKMAEGGTPAPLTVDPNLAEMGQSSNAVLLYGEGVHGNIEGYNRLNTTVLIPHRFDWIGMEMLTPAQQKDLDTFVQADEASPEYTQALKALIDYFAVSWNRTNPKTTGEENYYFKIVELMRQKKTRVIGMEGVGIPYIFFRYGETDFGGAVRNYVWAKTVPTSGRGLVYGGSAHFDGPRSVNFQDFLLIRNPGAHFFVLAPIKTRTSQ